MWSGFPLFPEQASSLADDVDALYLFLVVVTVFFSTLIASCIVYFAIRYRRRTDDYYPTPVIGSKKLEMTWTVIPLMLASVMFFWGASVYFDIFRRPENIPPVVDSAIALGAKVIWMQLGIEHQEAAAKAVAAGLVVVMDACFFVEHKRRRSSL